jgi:hypothetical protein
MRPMAITSKDNVSTGNVSTGNASGDHVVMFAVCRLLFSACFGIAI